MSLDKDWNRIAAIHCRDDGEIAAVWLAHDKESDCVHLYDGCEFKAEVLAVIAEGLNSKPYNAFRLNSKWIPVAWEISAKHIVDNLRDRGCNMLYEGVKDSEMLAEAISRDVWERMRTDRFKVDKRMSGWLEQYKSFQRKEGKIPLVTHPQHVALRYAMVELKSAKREPKHSDAHKLFPKVAIA